MKFKAKDWLRQIWPHETERNGLLQQYASLGTQKLLLTDIALRGAVFSDLHVRTADGATDIPATMIALGRRDLALELIELAGERPERLFDLIPRPLERSPNERR